jgi:hypothetical protein
MLMWVSLSEEIAIYPDRLQPMWPLTRGTAGENFRSYERVQINIKVSGRASRSSYTGKTHKTSDELDLKKKTKRGIGNDQPDPMEEGLDA